MGAAWIAVIITQWVVILLLCLVCIGILRYLAVFRERMEIAAPPTTAMSPGEQIGDLEFHQIGGGLPFRIPNGRPCLLAFVTAACGGCREFLSQVNDILVKGRRDTGIDIALVVLVSSN
jgi:hypothetical protein